MKRIVVSGLAVLVVLGLAAPVAAQSKTAKCGQIHIVVDVKEGSSWSNNAMTLALLEDGGGWVIAEGNRRGQNCPAKNGEKLRFNFNDGANHTVNVEASSQSNKVNVRGGSTPAIVLVDVTGGGSTAAVHFDITGSPNPKAKIGGCPGGNFYLDIE